MGLFGLPHSRAIATETLHTDYDLAQLTTKVQSFSVPIVVIRRYQLNKGGPSIAYRAMNDIVGARPYPGVSLVSRNPYLHGSLFFLIFASALYAAYLSAPVFPTAATSAIWLPGPVLLCALLKADRRWWPALILATLPIRLLTGASSGAPPWLLLAAAAVDSGQAVVAARLLQLTMKDPMRFASVRDFASYCSITVLLTPATGAFFGALLDTRPELSYWAGWQQLFLSTSLANLIVTPAIFYWCFSLPTVLDSARKVELEATVLICGLLISVIMAFEPSSSGLGFVTARLYAPLGFMAWAALRFGVTGASGAMAVLTAFALRGVFAHHAGWSTQSAIVLASQIQQFLLLRAAPTYLVGVLVDAGRRSEQSLRESEHRFRTLADAAPVLVWMTAHDKQRDFFNKAWLDFTGRTIEQEGGDGWQRGIHPDDLGCIQSCFEAFEDRRPYDGEYRLRRHDGAYRWILARDVPRYTLDGDFVGYIGSAIDVTDRRLQQETLRRSEARYREVVESQPDFVCRFLPDLTLTLINDAYCRFVNCSKEELLGTKFLCRLPLGLQASMDNFDALIAVAAVGESFVWNSEFKRADGSATSIHWSCLATMAAEGGLNEFQAIGRDVTDRKRAEEADRKLAQAMRLASLGELTAVVSHEISQPLLAMQSNADAADNLLQLQDPPIGELRTIIADIRKDNLRVGEVIRIVRGLFHKRDVDLRRININEVVDRVARLTGADACRRHVQWLQDIAMPLPAVLGDTASLEQVLLNLVMNAMDAMHETPESERKLIVSTRASDDGGVLLSVADQGHGIAPDSMIHLFDSFFTTKAHGMGLGLSTSRSIVIAHRGRIWAANGGNGGATFYIWLPPATVTDPATNAGTVRAPALKFCAPPGNLLGLEILQANRRHPGTRKRWNRARLAKFSVDD